MNDLTKTILTFLTAWLLIVGSFVMIDRIINSLADPEQAAIPETVLSMVLGGLIPILTLAGQFVFQSEAARSTARAISSAATDAARNALATPGAPVTTTTTTPEGATTVTEPPITAEEDSWSTPSC